MSFERTRREPARLATLCVWRTDSGKWMIRVQKAEEGDWPEIWQVIEPELRLGETYPIAPDVTQEQAHKVWLESPQSTYVAKDANGKVVATYYLKPNQPGLGSHVCNCGYIVGERARGQGVGTLPCEHSQREAVRLGYRAMQFNLVVSTNEPAIRLWKKMGFALVGALPGAFRHARLGFVDAYMMYKQLEQ